MSTAAGRRELMRAGAATLVHNAPLGDARAARLADWLAAPGAPALDIGCGRGAFARLLAARGAVVTGIDTDDVAIAGCGRADPTSRYVCVDAAEWTERADRVSCIGSSHALGDDPYDRLADLVEHDGRALVGDGFWVEEPSEWCRATFGELADGLGGLAAAAEGAGFAVLASDASTLAEWDAFESAWCDGVEAVGTAAARRFADERRADYRRYRGVLGFGWLRLARPPLGLAGRDGRLVG